MKCRALIQRTRLRDLYDVVHIFERVLLENGVSQKLIEIIEEKLRVKGLVFANVFLTIEDKAIDEARESWSYMLGHQIQPLNHIQWYIDRFERVKNALLCT